jgi:HAD superfamily hydrolase (TIGR01456 family)
MSVSNSKGVVLDIDGVILRGGALIPGAVEAVQYLVQHKVPFVFVTNGGGMLEEKKAEDLSKKLGIKVSSDQIILCHTPFRALASQFCDKPVLIVGRDECVNVAKHYGFTQVITPNDLFASCQDVLPVRKGKLHHNEDHKNHHELRDSIEAALIFHDPVDWTLDMQVLSDVIRPLSSNDQQKQLFASNADIVYATEYCFPRFTQGAFVESFRHLYQLHHETELKIKYYGKPFSVQYEYAEELLRKEALRLGVPVPEMFYGIGDNPKSDIRGANQAGENWTSMLVRTGLFHGEQVNDHHDPADYVFDNVLEAVNHIVSSK